MLTRAPLTAARFADALAPLLARWRSLRCSLALRSPVRHVYRCPAVRTGAGGDQGDLGPLHLPLPGLAPQLQYRLELRVEPVQVALRQQPAVRVHHHVTAVGGPAVREVGADLTLAGEAEVLHHRHHGVGEAVVDAGHVDVTEPADLTGHPLHQA